MYFLSVRFYLERPVRVELTSLVLQTNRLPQTKDANLAPAEGLEPSQTVLETVVLPLHYAGI